MPIVQALRTVYPPFLQLVGLEQRQPAMNFVQFDKVTPQWADLRLSRLGRGYGAFLHHQHQMPPRAETMEVTIRVNAARESKTGRPRYNSGVGGALEHGVDLVGAGVAHLSVVDEMLLFALEADRDVGKGSTLADVGAGVLRDVGPNADLFLVGMIPLTAIVMMEIDGSGKSGSVAINCADVVRPQGNLVRAGDLVIEITGLMFRAKQYRPALDDGFYERGGRAPKVTFDAVLQWLISATNKVKGPGERRGSEHSWGEGNVGSWLVE